MYNITVKSLSHYEALSKIVHQPGYRSIACSFPKFRYNRV